MSVDHRMNTIIYYRIDYKVLLVLLVFMHADTLGAVPLSLLSISNVDRDTAYISNLNQEVF